MTFHVGQKVVFIGPDFRSHSIVLHHGLIVPAPREVYTVRGFAQRADGPGIFLEEIVNAEKPSFRDGICEMAMDTKWFRPLVEPKAEASFTIGAPKDSERWDNRVKKRERV